MTADASSLLHQYQDLFVAIGDNKRRIQLIKERMSDGFSVPYIVHPSSVICAGTAIGVGRFVAANSVVGVADECGGGDQGRPGEPGIGQRVAVGAGAAVVSNVDDKQQMLGVPACKKGS